MVQKVESSDSYYSPWEKAFGRISTPFEEFLHQETTGGIVLMVCTVIAIVLANSALAAEFTHILHTHLSLSIGNWRLDYSLHHWINDGLMALFFFVVGLEIKREVLVGDLTNIKSATLPIVAALGGMVAPALVYSATNWDDPSISGWGIPMATDIAFAIGVLAMLGKRVPKALYTFLVALAIVDDLGAVVVIAIFYTDQIVWEALVVAAVILGLLIILNRIGVRHPLLYFMFGIFLWLAFLQSGIHATIAGVLTALAVPYRPKFEPETFKQHIQKLLVHFDAAHQGESTIINNERQRAVVQAIEHGIHSVESPLQRLEHSMHGYVAFFIIPLFALANAGIPISGESLATAFSHEVGLGVILGLLLGKIVGIAGVSLILVKLGWASFPENCNAKHIIGTGILAGIGFTMSIFIAELAFAGQNETLVIAKTGILCASLFAGIGGYLWLRYVAR